MAKAPDEEARQDWEIEESVLHDVASMRAADLEEQRERIARYEAMIAEIDAEEAARSRRNTVQIRAASPLKAAPISAPPCCRRAFHAQYRLI
jgi:hypothetical protein